MITSQQLTAIILTILAVLWVCLVLYARTK